MKTVKRVLTIAMCAALILTSAPLSGFVGLDLESFFKIKSEAAELEAPESVVIDSGYCGENLTWIFEESGVLKITGTGNMWTFWSVDSPQWYEYREQIKTIIIANGVTNIGQLAFYECTNLTNVIIPDSVTEIGRDAFSYCTSLENIDLPHAITNISDGTFEYCSSLTDVKIPLDVTYIGSRAFAFCESLTSITIPARVSYIEPTAFYASFDITNVYYLGAEAQWESMEYDGFYSKATIYSDSLSWSLDNGTLTITGTGPMEDYTSADEVPWHSSAETIKSVEISDGIINIGSFAFSGCTNLTDVNIPDSVWCIGKYSFSSCEDLSNIDISDNVKWIYSFAFWKCASVEKFIIPASVTCVGSSAFADCYSLKSIVVDSDNSYYSSDLGALYNKNQTKIYQYPLGNKSNCFTILSTVTIIDERVFACAENLESINIPNGVAQIGYCAFYQCNNLSHIYYNGTGAQWREISIDDGNYSFYTATIHYLAEEESITEEYTTEEWTTEENITEKNTIAPEIETTAKPMVTEPPSIEDEPDFDYTEPTQSESAKIYIDVSCNNLDSTISKLTYIFEYENGTTITSEDIVAAVKAHWDEEHGSNKYKISQDVFYETPGYLTVIFDSITVESGKTYQFTVSMEELGQTGGTCGDNLTWFLDLNTGLLTISGTGEMGGWNSSNEKPWEDYLSDIKNVVIEDGVTTIGFAAFCNCYNLTSVTIGNSVTTIGNYAFGSCDRLTNINVDTNNKYYSSDSYGVLFNKDKTTLVQYPAGNKRTNYIIPDSVTSIGYSAFKECRSLTSVTISDSVTTIGSDAFFWCTSLTSVTIPDSVTTIGSDAFYGCSSLTSVTISDSVTTIGYAAFYDCYSLTSITVDEDNENYSSDSYGVLFNKDKTTLVQYPIGNTRTSYTIPDSVTSIGEDAFSGCTSLTSITIPDSVTTINGWAFSNCHSLTSVTVDEDNENYSSDSYGVLFNKDKTLLIQYPIGNIRTSYTIPDSVTTIGRSAFYSCDNLTSVTIPDSVTTINGWAFSNCHSLTSVTIPDSVTSIDNYAFLGCYNLNDVYYYSTEEMWHTISIAEGNEVLTSAAIHFNECEHPEDQLSWETVKEATCVPGLEVATCGVCGKRGGKKTVVCDSSTYPESEHNYADGINQTWNFSYPGAKKLILKFSDLTETESCCDYIYLYDSNGCYIGLYFGTYLSGETIEIEGNGFSIELISDYSVNYYGFSFDSISAVVDNDLNRVIPAVSEHDWSNKDGVCANGCGTECTHPDGTQGACDACGYSCAVSGHIIRSDGKCSLCGKTGGTCYENLTWIFDEVTGELNISGTGKLYYYDFNYTEAPWYEYYSSIKTIIIGDGVTGIPDFAFYNYYNLTNVTIGNGVATIGAYAFSECQDLKSVTIPDSVTTIGSSAFSTCDSLTSVTIGNSVTTIGHYAFYNCDNLTSVTIPDSVTTIGDYAFVYCSNLTNVTLGKGLTQIRTNIFVGCNVLSEINVNEANENYCSVDGVLYNKNKTVIVAYPAGKMDKEFTIPDTVKEIGTYSFAGCNNLQTLYIPESVTTIGAYAFENCYNLNIVFSSNEFTSIGDYAFAGCTFTSFVIPEGVESIGNYAFAYCYNLEEIVIPDSVTAIGENAFDWCSSLKTIDIPDSVKTIGSYAFYECYSLETVKLGNGIDEIPQSMFGYCYALKEIEIPNGVTSIGTGAFYYCENLNTVIIPESVSTIDAEAFAVCKSLKSFEVNAENDKFCSENGVLFNKDKTKIISYPAGKTDKTYAIPSSVTSIESYAFSASKNLYYITIPSTVTSIGEYAFAYSNLVSLFLEDGITKVTSYSFTHCEKLASVTIPATVTLIEDNAFNCCRSLKEIYYYGSERDWQAVEIGSNNFLANAKMYYLDSAADSDYVFANGELIVNGPEIVSIKFADMDFADEIVKVTVKSGVSKILPFVFADLPNLTEVNISKSVFCIGDFAFENCVNIEAVNLDVEFDDETVEEESSGYIEEPWGEISDPDIGLLAEAPDSVPTLPPVPVTTLPPVAPITTIPYTEYPSSPEESTVAEEEYSEQVTFNDRPTKPATTNPQPSEEEYSSDNRLIGIMAFAGCANLENIVVPGTFKTVGNYAFADCTKLADVTLENGIETIGCAAFNNCTSLSEIAIPESTKKLGYDAFYGCSSLETVYYNAIDCYLFGASDYELIAFGECASIKNFIFGNKVETIPSYLLRENTGITEIDIPDSVITIGNYAFSQCYNLTSVTIGNSVTTISSYAFYDCTSLTSVTIPDSVITIGGCAFCGCTNLASVTIGNSVTIIGGDAFRYCGTLTNVTIPDSVTSIGYSAFYSCDSLTSVTIPDSVTDIGWFAFSSCDNLESITVDAKNEYYSSDSCGVLFNKDKTDLIQYPAGNKRLSYDIPETVVAIYDEAFFCCENLINVTIPEGVTDIYSYAFTSCTELKSIVLPDSLTIISDYMFSNCSSLTSVAIPESVTDIYYAAFSECYSLSDVYYSGSEEQWEEIYITADNTPLLSANIHFNSEPPEPDKIIASGVCGESLNWVLYDDGILEISGKGAMHDFEDGTEPWYRFKSTILQVIVEDGVTTIGDGAFFDCPNLKSVTLGADITSIGFEAFKCCGNITDVYYNGTTEQWNSISIDKYNEDLTNAALHFKPQQQTSNCKISIKRPDVKNVNYGDTLMFEAVVNNLPQGAKIVWKVSGASAKLKVAEDGMSCTVRVTGAGELKISASVVSEQGVPYKNANGNNISSHKTFTAKAGFWEFIIWIFKSIFGTTPVYPPETLL